jgi:chloramphenicol-sensitive protein RarD
VGVAFALVAYGLWGVFPLYFLLLQPATAFEVVAFRVLFSLVFCAIVLTVTRAWARIAEIVRSPRVLLLLAMAGVLIYINWIVYVLAVDVGAVVDAALGYFINPIVTVLLGVIVLRERLRPAQWAAVGIATAAIVVIAVGGATLPWIALVLAASFGLYGLVKKRVGSRVDALAGLTIETAWLAPIAGIQLALVGATTGVTLGHHGPLQAVGLLLAGVVTAIPLLLFAGAARRLPLVAIGLTQFVTPILQFIIGVALLHEVMPTSRWIGFGLVWVALAVLMVDLVVASRRRGTVPAPASTPGH